MVCNLDLKTFGTCYISILAPARCLCLIKNVVAAAGFGSPCNNEQDITGIKSEPLGPITTELQET